MTAREKRVLDLAVRIGFGAKLAGAPDGEARRINRLLAQVLEELHDAEQDRLDLRRRLRIAQTVPAAPHQPRGAG